MSGLLLTGTMTSRGLTVHGVPVVSRPREEDKGDTDRPGTRSRHEPHLSCIAIWDRDQRSRVFMSTPPIEVDMGPTCLRWRRCK